MTKSVPANQREWHPDNQANDRRDKRVPTQESSNVRRARAQRDPKGAFFTSLLGGPSTNRVESGHRQEHGGRTEQLSTASAECFGRQ